MTPQQYRRISQISFLALFIAILAGGIKSIHNLCPYAIICFGALKGNLFTFAVGIATLGISMGVGFMVLALYHGRVFCGYVCPFGTMQELIYKVRGKKKRSQIIPYPYEKKLSKIKYGVLALNLILASWGWGYLYMNLCPIYTLSTLTWGGLIGLGLILIGAVATERLFCRYLCPYAALLNLAQTFGGWLGIKRTKILRNLERCVDCRMCNVICPMNIDLLSEEYVQNVECIHCLKCADKCPKPGTICCQEER